MGDFLDKEVELQAELNVRLTQQAQFLMQKSRVKWLNDGDRNTSFFHSSLCAIRSRGAIESLDIDGVMIQDKYIIADHITSFFMKIFSLNRLLV